MIERRIHIFGASGSGTTSLGAALAAALDAPHVDCDTYYWQPTDPPYTRANDRDIRLRLLQNAIAGLPSWVLSGSMCGWGDPLMHRITLAVFMHLDPAIRLARVAERERARFGSRIEADGDMHAQHHQFMTWAASYDDAAAPTRSLALHEAWMRRLRCHAVRLDSRAPTAMLVEQIRARAIS